MAERGDGAAVRLTSTQDCRSPDSRSNPGGGMDKLKGGLPGDAWRYGAYQHQSHF